MRRRRTVVSIALVLLAPFARAPLDAQRSRLTAPSIAAIEHWVRAVNEHVPGQPDASVERVVGMTYDVRVELDAVLPLFVRILRDNVLLKGGDLEQRLTALGRDVRRDPGFEAIVKRAAVLHADAVVFARRFSAPDDGPWVRSASPLLSNERITIARDGEVVGSATVNWNLPFARSLLNLLPRGGDQGFVGDWYHAVSAYLFSRGMNADATGHLKQAERVLPDDPRALFDRATYAEAFGLPVYQVLDDAQIPGEGRTNGEAERLYRRAFEGDPAFVEARVRLARLLDHRGRHDEAAAEISGALDAGPTGVTAFYAYLVAGRIATARGRHEDALRLYGQAGTLYRHAQSARLGASHAALMLDDVPQALAPLAALGGTAFQDADPWLDYHLGAGRDARTLFEALWARAAQGAR